MSWGGTIEDQRERKRAYNAAYYASHKEELLRKQHERYMAHRDEINAKRRARGTTPAQREAKRLEMKARRERFQRGEQDVKHGTPHAYNVGCRCDVCKEAHSIYQKEYRAKVKAERERMETVDLVEDAWSADTAVVYIAGRGSFAIELPPCEKRKKDE